MAIIAGEKRKENVLFVWSGSLIFSSYVVSGYCLISKLDINEQKYKNHIFVYYSLATGFKKCIVFSICLFPTCKDEYNLNPGLEWDDEFAGRTYISLFRLSFLKYHIAN